LRKYLALAAFGTALTTATILLPSTVSAGPTPKATGGVELSGRMQYLSFNAFDYTSRDRGTVHYTNFEENADGTGVWNVMGDYPITFTFQAVDYQHNLTVTSINPTSPTSTEFTGTGAYSDPSLGITWTIDGVVSGSTINFDIDYVTGGPPNYSLTATGVINSDGSMSGTSTDSQGDTLPWFTPAGSVHEVFSYTAPVTCANVDSASDTAAFSYVIPEDAAIAANVPVLFTMTDGGSSGAGNDIIGFTTTFTNCDVAASVSNQTIVDGNLVVH
jgi:hypothetical protein